MIGRRAVLAGAAALMIAPAHALSVNGLDQRRADLVMRTEGPLGADVYNLAGRTRVAVTPTARTTVLVISGQSTKNNSVSGFYTPRNPTRILNLSIAHGGAVFVAQEPLLCSDLVRGHDAMYLADMLIDAGLCDQVVIVMIAFGGSNVANWCPGGGVGNGIARADYLSWRFGLAARCIYAAGLWDCPRIHIRQIGEWDTDAPTTSHADYVASESGVIAECKRVGLLSSGAPMLVNLNTRPIDPTAARLQIRAAQAAVCDGVTVRIGSDIDQLGLEYRNPYPDQTHFTPTGAQAEAALDFVGVRRFLLHG